MSAKGRKVIIVLESTRYRVEVDNAPRDEALVRNGSHQDMLDAGYVLLLDAYPNVQKHPFAEISDDLADLYVQARPIRTA